MQSILVPATIRSAASTPGCFTVVLHFSALYPLANLFTSGPNNQGNIQPMHILQGKTGLEKDPFIRCQLLPPDPGSLPTGSLEIT